MTGCGCKGQRTCFICRPNAINDQPFDEECKTIYYYCDNCNTCDMSTKKHVCFEGKIFPGVRVIKDFLTEDEEMAFLNKIDSQKWILSQSGRRKQDFGPKVNFKQEKVKLANFTGLPNYAKCVLDKLNNLIEKRFRAVEMCNLEYLPERGSCIVPHFDDSWLWGPRLITLNLLSSTYLTFSLPQDHNYLINDFEPTAKVKIHLPRRSVIIVDGPARYDWMHEILRADINSRRIATTFRELSCNFDPDVTNNVNKNREMGLKLLELAESYNGFSLGESVK